MEGERDMGNVAEELLMICLDKGSKDNMSATVVAFPAAQYGEGGGVTARVRAREERERAADEAAQCARESEVSLVRRTHDEHAAAADTSSS